MSASTEVALSRAFGVLFSSSSSNPQHKKTTTSQKDALQNQNSSVFGSNLGRLSLQFASTLSSYSEQTPASSQTTSASSASLQPLGSLLRKPTFATDESEESSSSITLKSASIIRFCEPGKPEASGTDLYIDAPPAHVESHFAKGHIAQVVGAKMFISAKGGIPAKEGSQIGIFHHFRPQITGVGTRIGLTVFMNGINVSEKEFKKYGEVVFSQINQRTPTIGLYNQSYGFVWDTGRLAVEKVLPLVTTSIRIMDCFLQTLTNHFYAERRSIKSKAPCLMIVHSEGGLILYSALKNLDRRLKDIVKNYLYIITLGSVRPIPNKYGVYVINIYSKKDHVTNPFASSYVDKPGYNLKHVCCTSAADERIARLIDHAFLADTYQKHLKGQIEHLAQTVGLG